MEERNLDKSIIEYFRRTSINKQNFDEAMKGFTSLLTYGKPEQYETDVLDASKSQDAYEKWEAAYLARKEEQVALYREEQRLGKAGYLVNPQLTASDKRIIEAWNDPSKAENNCFDVTINTGLLSYPKISNEELEKFGLRKSRQVR